MNAAVPERVLLATTCFEKSGRKKERLCIFVVTQSRIILSPVPDPVARNENPLPAKGNEPPVPATGPLWRRWLKGPQAPTHDSVAAMVQEYRTRKPEEILIAGKDAWEIPFGEISDITIRRVRNTGKNSRFRSFFLSPYPFEPASARYAVDYQLTLRTPGETYTILTPFLLELKQILVNQIRDRVTETIDSTAPLL